MDMLEISKVDAQIGITTRNAKMYIQQPPASFEIEHKDAKLIIHTEQARILIDQQQCFNESGLMDPTALAEDIAQRSKQAAIEGIARRVDEGNQLADVRNRGNAIAQIAFNNTFENHEFNMVTMPQSPPKFDVAGGTVDIQVEEGYVIIHSTPNRPIIDVEPGSVEINMKRYPEIHIQYVGNKVDEKI
jgi:hypothetical protein